MPRNSVILTCPVCGEPLKVDEVSKMDSEKYTNHIAVLAHCEDCRVPELISIVLPANLDLKIKR